MNIHSLGKISQSLQQEHIMQIAERKIFGIFYLEDFRQSLKNTEYSLKLADLEIKPCQIEQRT